MFTKTTTVAISVMLVAGCAAVDLQNQAPVEERTTASPAQVPSPAVVPSAAKPDTGSSPGTGVVVYGVTIAQPDVRPIEPLPESAGSSSAPVISQEGSPQDSAANSPGPVEEASEGITVLRPKAVPDAPELRPDPEGVTILPPRAVPGQ